MKNTGKNISELQVMDISLCYLVVFAHTFSEFTKDEKPITEKPLYAKKRAASF